MKAFLRARGLNLRSARQVYSPEERALVRMETAWEQVSTRLEEKAADKLAQYRQQHPITPNAVPSTQVTQPLNVRRDPKTGEMIAVH